MFAWLTDVFASSGFVAGQAWASGKDRNWQALKAAYATWWPVELVRRPHRRASAALARAPWVGRAARWLWTLGGLALLGWFGPAPAIAWAPFPAPGFVGWLGAVGCLVAFVLFVPRLRGAAVLRPPKAAVLVALLGVLYWGLTAASFHYAFGVDVWSPALWADVRAAWHEGRNLRWSAFWLLVGDTLLWVAAVVLVWARVSRVWVGLKVWGLWTMKWCLRALVFGVVGYAVLSFFGFGWWQLAEWLARSLAAFPAAADTVSRAPAWAVAAVFFILGLVLLNLVIVVLETVSDILCFITKMLSIAFYGGVVNAHRHGDPDAPPKRIIGLVERFDRSQLAMAERYEGYLRHRLANEFASGITNEGWQEAREPAEDASAAPDEGAPRTRTRRRWWPFGAAAGVPPEPAEATPDDADPGQKEAPDTATAGTPATVRAEGSQETHVVPEEEPELSSDETPETPGPVDTSARDEFLALDGEEAREAHRAAGQAAPEAAPGPAPAAVETGAPSAPAGPDLEAEAEVLESARAVEAAREQTRDEVVAEVERRYDLEQERLEAQSADEYQHYSDGTELLDVDPDGEDDPFGPGARDEYGGEVDEYWEAQEDMGATVYAAPFLSDDEGLPVDPDAEPAQGLGPRHDQGQASLDFGMDDSRYGVAGVGPGGAGASVADAPGEMRESAAGSDEDSAEASRPGAPEGAADRVGEATPEQVSAPPGSPAGPPVPEASPVAHQPVEEVSEAQPETSHGGGLDDRGEGVDHTPGGGGLPGEDTDPAGARFGRGSEEEEVAAEGSEEREPARARATDPFRAAGVDAREGVPGDGPEHPPRDGLGNGGGPVAASRSGSLEDARGDAPGAPVMGTAGERPVVSVRDELGEYLGELPGFVDAGEQDGEDRVGAEREESVVEGTGAAAPVAGSSAGTALDPLSRGEVGRSSAGDAAGGDGASGGVLDADAPAASDVGARPPDPSDRPRARAARRGARSRWSRSGVNLRAAVSLVVDRDAPMFAPLVADRVRLHLVAGEIALRPRGRVDDGLIPAPLPRRGRGFGWRRSVECREERDVGLGVQPTAKVVARGSRVARDLGEPLDGPALLDADVEPVEEADLAQHPVAQDLVFPTRELAAFEACPQSVEAPGLGVSAERLAKCAPSPLG